MEIEKMKEKAIALHQHVLDHPKDYQAVIAELKLHSKIIDRQRKERVDDRLKEIALIRRRLNEKQGQ